MLRNLKNKKDLKILTNLYINNFYNNYNSNNNHSIICKSFVSSRKKNDDLILDGTVEYLSREESSTESIKMLLDQLNSNKTKKSSSILSGVANKTKKPVILANRDQIIEEENVDDNEEYDDYDDDDFDDRIEIYDENDQEITDFYNENEILDTETKLKQYENDEHRMDGMEDHVFDDDQNDENYNNQFNQIKKDKTKKEIKDKNKKNEILLESNIKDQNTTKIGDNYENEEENETENYNEDDNELKEIKKPLTKKEKKEAKKKLEEKIRKQYGDKAEKILHKIEMKHKYGKWDPQVKIPRKDMDQLRELHKENPDYYTVAVLAENFGIAEGAVSRILRSKWQPDSRKLESIQKKKIEENREKYSPYSKLNKDFKGINLSYQSKVGLNKKENPVVLPNSVIEKIDMNEWYHQAKNYNKYRIESTKRSNKINSNNKIEKKEIDLNSRFEKIKQLENLLK